MIVYSPWAQIAKELLNEKISNSYLLVEMRVLLQRDGCPVIIYVHTSYHLSHVYRSNIVYRPGRILSFLLWSIPPDRRFSFILRKDPSACPSIRLSVFWRRVRLCRWYDRNVASHWNVKWSVWSSESRHSESDETKIHFLFFSFLLKFSLINSYHIDLCLVNGQDRFLLASAHPKNLITIFPWRTNKDLLPDL